jgi:murein DD-endopeptidase MepM/ murein hydrolase activator NlpD
MVSVTFLACGSQYGRSPLRGEWITVASGDIISKIALRYSVSQEDIVEINGIHDPSRIIVGQRLFIPRFPRDLSRGVSGDVDTHQRLAENTDDQASISQLSGFRSLKGAPIEVMRQMRWPLSLSLKKGIGLSSGFGTRKGKPHKGVDIRAPLGTPVHAALRGEVIRSEYSSGGYGWVIYLRHAGGVQTRYAHHQKNIVRVGQVVQTGSVIGLVGNSGRSTGPHLHFEIRIQGEAVDPLIFMPAVSSSLSSLSSLPFIALFSDLHSILKRIQS